MEGVDDLIDANCPVDLVVSGTNIDAVGDRHPVALLQPNQLE
jgi:hypothetical protein